MTSCRTGGSCLVEAAGDVVLENILEKALKDVAVAVYFLHMLEGVVGGDEESEVISDVI